MRHGTATRRILSTERSSHECRRDAAGDEGDKTRRGTAWRHRWIFCVKLRERKRAVCHFCQILPNSQVCSVPRFVKCCKHKKKKSDLQCLCFQQNVWSDWEGFLNVMSWQMESFRDNLRLGKQGVSALLGMAVIYVAETVKSCMEQFPSAPTDYNKIAMMTSSPCCHVSGGHSRTSYLIGAHWHFFGTF